MRKMLKILCYQPCDEIGKAIKAVDWKNSKWKGLDKYSNVYGSVDWEEGSAGLVWHKSCKVEICRERERERELQQALDRKKKMMQCSKTEVQIERPSAPPRKVLESFIRKIFTYGVWKEMTHQSILRGTNSTRFMKISFGKSLKQVLCM